MKIKKENKNTNTTITAPEESKNVGQFETYTDTYLFREKPISPQGIERLAQEFIKWAREDENALKVSSFFKIKGIPMMDIERWIKKPEFWKLKLAYTEGLEIIGDRREMGALNKKLSEGMITHSMPQYDRDWKNNIEWRSRLRREEKADQQNQGPQIVVLERFPGCDLVPERSLLSNPESEPRED